MTGFDAESKLRELLRAGEGRYIEFKSPSVNLSDLESCGGTLRAIASFLSTPGEESAWLILGIVEGDDLTDLKTRVLSAVSKHIAGNQAEWEKQIQLATIEPGGKPALVLGHREELTGTKGPHDTLMEQMKRALTGLPPGTNVRAWRPFYHSEVELPGIGKSFQVTMFEFPPTGQSVGLVRAKIDIPAKGKIKDRALIRGFGYYRYMASDSKVPPEAADQFTELWGMRESLRISHRGWKRSAVLLVAALALTLTALAIMLLYWRPGTVQGAPLASLAQGVEVELKWQDFKARDLKGQLAGMSEKPSQLLKLAYLNKTREFIQNQLYRIGAWPANVPDPGTDGGDGHVQITAYQISKDSWQILGSGYVREYEKPGQGNHEVWGVELRTEALFKDEIEPGDIVRVDGTLASAVRRTEAGEVAQPVHVFFLVQMDASNLWQATPEDENHFGDSQQTRVFVDTSTLTGIDLPQGGTAQDRKVHIGSIVWNRKVQLGE